jgi:hypothetical protein
MGIQARGSVMSLHVDDIDGETLMERGNSHTFFKNPTGTPKAKMNMSASLT